MVGDQMDAVQHGNGQCPNLTPILRAFRISLYVLYMADDLLDKSG
jgi:hypothetical protein